MNKRSRILLIIIFVVTIALAGAAVYIGWRLSQEKEVTPEPGEAADTGISCAGHEGNTECNTDPNSEYFCHDLYCDPNTGNWDDQGTACVACAAQSACDSICQATTTAATGRCDPAGGSGTCWFSNSNGRCCVDADGCYSPDPCYDDLVWDLDNDFSCPAGQMATCSENGPVCTSSLCDSPTCECPDGYTPCSDGDAGAILAEGSCPECNNPYWDWCCPSQTTTSSTSSSSSSTTSTTTTTTTTSTSTTTTTPGSTTTTTTPASTTTTTIPTSTTTGTTTVPTAPPTGVLDDFNNKIPVAVVLIITGITIYVLNIGTKTLEPLISKVEYWMDSSPKEVKFKKRFEKQTLNKIEKKSKK